MVHSRTCKWTRKHLKRKFLAWLLQRLEQVYSKPDVIGLHSLTKNKHSVDISLESKFHNETTFHQSWWVHLNGGYWIYPWQMKENIQYMRKRGGSEWMQHFPKSWFIPTEKTLTVKSFRNWNLSKTKKWVLNDSSYRLEWNDQVPGRQN